MTNRITTIARYTVLEAVRTRLPLVTLVLIGVLLAASLFVREIALTESARFQTGFYGAAVRFAAVFVAALYAISSIAREFQDKGLEVALALDVPRSHYIVGKLAGLFAAAAALSFAVTLPLVPLAGWEPAAAWGASLAFELALVIAMSVFCVITFNQLMPAASVVLAFYLFARVLTAIRLIASNPISDGQTLSYRVMAWFIEGVALVIPALDQWTRTRWLLEHAAPWGAVLAIAFEATLFVLVLAAAAIFDMHRKNF